MLTVILAGGLGTRLRAVVDDRPKVMAPVAGRPFLEHLLAELRRQGVTKVLLAIGYMGSQVRAHFQTGSRLGMDLTYSDEGEQLLGTAGAIRLALQTAGTSGGEKDVLVLNGDTYVGFDLSKLRLASVTESTRLTMLLVRVENASRYGVVEVDRAGVVLRFHERGEPTDGLINAGVYYARRSELSALVADSGSGPHSFEKDVLSRIIGGGLCGVVTEGPFVDIGVPEDYERAQTLLAGRFSACP